MLGTQVQNLYSACFVLLNWDFSMLGCQIGFCISQFQDAVGFRMVLGGLRGKFRGGLGRGL